MSESASKYQVQLQVQGPVQSGAENQNHVMRRSGRKRQSAHVSLSENDLDRIVSDISDDETEKAEEMKKRNVIICSVKIVLKGTVFKGEKGESELVAKMDMDVNAAVDIDFPVSVRVDGKSMGNVLAQIDKKKHAGIMRMKAKGSLKRMEIFKKSAKKSDRIINKKKRAKAGTCIDNRNITISKGNSKVKKKRTRPNPNTDPPASTCTKINLEKDGIATDANLPNASSSAAAAAASGLANANGEVHENTASSTHRKKRRLVTDKDNAGDTSSKVKSKRNGNKKLGKEKKGARRVTEQPIENKKSKRTHPHTHPHPHVTESTHECFDDLGALPDAPPLLLDFPNTGKCIWTFDDKQRVLLANFNAGSLPNELTSIDEIFLLRMMERTDIVVVSEGLLTGRDEFLWDTDFIDMRAGDIVHDRFRLFKKPLTTTTIPTVTQTRTHAGEQEDVEPDNLSLKISDYNRYIIKCRESQTNPKSDPICNYTTLSGEEKELDIRCESLSLVNLDLKRILPETYDDFKANFLAPKLLPGGAHCMMNAVNSSGRPCLGPYLNYSLPGSFEQFCQNDDGTLDRAHLCIDGYSEVIMLTRLEGRRKRHAVHLLKTRSHRTDGKQKNADECQGVYHCGAESSFWPDKDAIQKCSKFQYYPCIFILKPGQLLHVNKGRLCAFRAVSCVPLSKEDCHFEPRNLLLEEEEVKSEQMFTSISWNWMFLGKTYGGIKEEVACTLKNAKLSQSKREKSLGIPQRSLVALAKFHLPRYRQLKKRAIAVNDDGGASLTILRGIHDGLREVLSKQINLFSEVRDGDKSFDAYEKLRINRSTDSNHDSLKATVDPFGNDFFCMLCNQELGNTYMHCDGCENLLQKDFNICINCHDVKDMRQADHQMNPTHSLSSALGRRCDINHIPLQKKTFSSRMCGCNVGGSKCRKCNFMACCSCKCHKQYTLRNRFYNEDEMRSLLLDVDTVLNECDTIGSLNPSAKARQRHSSVRNKCIGIVTNHCDTSRNVQHCNLEIKLSTNTEAYTKSQSVPIASLMKAHTPQELKIASKHDANDSGSRAAEHNMADEQASLPAPPTQNQEQYESIDEHDAQQNGQDEQARPPVPLIQDPEQAELIDKRDKTDSGSPVNQQNMADEQDRPPAPLIQNPEQAELINKRDTPDSGSPVAHHKIADDQDRPPAPLIQNPEQVELIDKRDTTDSRAADQDRPPAPLIQDPEQAELINKRGATASGSPINQHNMADAEDRPPAPLIQNPEQAELIDKRDTTDSRATDQDRPPAPLIQDPEQAELIDKRDTSDSGDTQENIVDDQDRPPAPLIQNPEQAELCFKHSVQQNMTVNHDRSPVPLIQNPGQAELINKRGATASGSPINRPQMADEQDSLPAPLIQNPEQAELIDKRDTTDSRVADQDRPPAPLNKNPEQAELIDKHDATNSGSPVTQENIADDQDRPPAPLIQNPDQAELLDKHDTADSGSPVTQQNIAADQEIPPAPLIQNREQAEFIDTRDKRDTSVSRADDQDRPPAPIIQDPEQAELIDKHGAQQNTADDQDRPPTPPIQDPEQAELFFKHGAQQNRADDQDRPPAPPIQDPEFEKGEGNWCVDV